MATAVARFQVASWAKLRLRLSLVVAVVDMVGIKVEFVSFFRYSRWCSWLLSRSVATLSSSCHGDDLDTMIVDSHLKRQGRGRANRLLNSSSCSRQC